MTPFLALARRGTGPSIVLAAVVGTALAGAACSSTKQCLCDNGVGPDSDDAGDVSDGEPGPHFGMDSGPPQAAVTIAPADPTVVAVVPGSPAKQTFTATSGGKKVAATWSIDDPRIGTIDKNGVFTASGTIGGTATITAQIGTMTGTTTVTVELQLTENAGKLTTAVQTQLGGTGSADGAFRWLYPYDKTVFPRGLTPPVLQFAGTGSTAVLVTAKAKNLVYKGYFGPSNPARVTLPASTWAAITGSVGVKDPLTVSITKVDAAGVSGPATETWTVAQGALTGTVYYNTYDSTLASGGPFGSNGAVMRIKPGKPAEVLFGGCTTCHSVSADGSTLVASAGHNSDDAYDLTSDGGVKSTKPDSTYSFGAVYPDGSMVLECATPMNSMPEIDPDSGTPYNVGVPGMGGSKTTHLYDTKTGVELPTTGLEKAQNAIMPVFSPDGKRVAFNDYDKGLGRTLAVASFDAKTRAFSGLTDVVTTSGTSWPAWPAFLPDSKSFLFGLVDSPDFATWEQHTGDLQIVDTASQRVTPLDTLNGMAAGKTYLPFGDAETHMNYEPTVLPVAVGGYYWAVFTSRREYGNTINDADAWASSPARRKKLWIAAIDLNPTPGTDPSHPAFYLNDQELEAGNMRGFWVLDPCKGNGTGCETGDQCCSGYCRAGGGDGGGLACVAPPSSGCAQEYEKCQKASDCCGSAAGFDCINGYCAEPLPK